MLRIDHLSKKFGNKTILDNISVQIPRGSIAVFVGSSGVGKSTLLRILNNLETFDQGTITLDGKTLDITSVNKTHTVGMVFQHFNLFEHLTVEENITLALQKAVGKTKAEAQQIAHEQLAQYGLADKKNVYVSQLSGGQKQRLALARMLALKPTIICLDEPTSALDPMLTASVANIIMQLAHAGYIVLVATHDTSLLARLSGMVYLMKQGKIIQSVSTEELKQHPEKYSQLTNFIAGHQS